MTVPQTPPAPQDADPSGAATLMEVRVLGAFRSALATPDLRKKILFTLGIVVVYRLGATMPAPGVSFKNVKQCVESVDQQGIYSLINLFSGGALLNLSIFALGIMPYITASIIVQLLTVVIPRFEQLKKEGPDRCTWCSPRPRSACTRSARSTARATRGASPWPGSSSTPSGEFLTGQRDTCFT